MKWSRIDLLLVLAIILMACASIPSWVPYLAPMPLVYRNLPFPVLNAPIYPGETIIMRVSRCTRDVDVPTWLVTRELVNLDTGRRMVLPASTSMVRLGCEVYDAQSAELPDDLIPGRYIYRGAAMVRGRWVDADVAWQTEPFEVVQP